jgi:DNA-binding LacI/PurR family transcriptional regulator
MAKQKKIQLQDIASAAGVNTSTVSMVLNGRARERRISERLEKKILKVAKDLNYKPNVLAQSLRSGKSHIIGVILPDMANSTFARLGRHIEELATQEGYRIMICSSGEEDNDPESLINSLIDYQVDGIIIAPTTHMQPSIRFGVGYNAVSIGICKERNIHVAYTPGTLTVFTSRDPAVAVRYGHCGKGNDGTGSGCFI